MRRVLATIAVALAAGCGGDGGTDGAAVSCEGLLKPADAAAALPEGVPAGVDGATFYEVESQGSTKRHYAYVAGTDFVQVRDRIKSAYEVAGMTIESVDEESVEAEFAWAGGTREGSVQVVNLCKDTLRLRYRVGPR